MHLMRIIASSLLVAVFTSNLFGSYGSDHADAALRQLHRATKTQSNGQHLLSLAALRALRDPDLRPFFHQFSQHPDWAVQVHAVLGIAELSDDQVIDPWLVQQISPSARAHVIAQGLDDGLFQTEQIEALLKWPLLETTPRLLLLADLYAMTGTTDQQMLKELTNNTDLSVALFAALLSENEKNIESTTISLRRATRVDRSTALQRTLQLIRQYQLSSASDWLLRLLEQNTVTLSEDERYWTLFTLLFIDQKSGLETWFRSFPTDPERREQVKYLLLLLESGIVPTPKHIERLVIELDDPLLGSMVRAGNVNKEKSTITKADSKALLSLVEHGHRGSTAWAFRVAKENLPLPLATSFYSSLSTVSEKSNAKRNDVAIKSFIRLMQVSPEDAWSILRSAKDDSEQQQLLLLAMLQIPNEDTVEEASKLRRIGLNKADIMTLLLLARGSAKLQENDQEYLGIIAAGGGHLSPALETQAAWLYLKRLGLADKALAAVRPQ